MEKTRKFKDLDVGDIIYHCNTFFTKEGVLNRSNLTVKEEVIYKVINRTSKWVVLLLSNNICVTLPSNNVKAYIKDKKFSTSKTYIEKEIKSLFKFYINGMKNNVKLGKECENTLKQLKENKII